MYEHECNPKNDALKITMYNFLIFFSFKAWQNVSGLKMLLLC